MVETKKTDSKNVKAAGKAADSKADKVVDLCFLEADDDFEEFPTEEWKAKAGEHVEENNIWEDNWDDDNIEEDFNKQLKNELQKRELASKK